MECLGSEQRVLSEAKEALLETDQKRGERDRIDERLEEDIDPQIDHWITEREFVSNASSRRRYPNTKDRSSAAVGHSSP